MPLIAPTVAIEAGKLRHRANLQSATEVEDLIKGRTETWSTYATVWASVREQPFVVSEDNATILYLVGIRYRSDVVKRQRVVVAGLTLKILEVENPERRNRKLTLHCAEVLD